MRILIFCVFVFLATGSLAAEPFAQAKIDNDDPIVPGQQVHVTVNVFVPDFFTAPPDFPLFDMQDATVTIPDQRTQNVVQTVNGVQYSGIGRSYVIIPERTGVFNLPALAIGLTYSQDGKPVSKQVSLAPASFTVVDPGNTQTANISLTAREVTISQSFDRDISSLRVGEALVRTITLSAKDTQAMMIPAIISPEADGLKIYAKSPKLEDNVGSRDRSSDSVRIETITYVAEKAGQLQVPGISYPWYDLDAHASAIATLPSTNINVSPAEPSPSGIPPEIDHPAETGKHLFSKQIWLAIFCSLAALLLGLWVIRRALPKLRSGAYDMQQGMRNSEARRFRQLMTAVKNDAPENVYKALETWIRRAGYQSISKFLSATADENLLRDVSNVESILFRKPSSGGELDRDHLKASLKAARFPKSDSGFRRSPGSLPELNPTGHSG